MRNFVHQSLYSPAFGYFTSRVVVGRCGEPIDFGSLKGQAEWLEVLTKLYAGRPTTAPLSKAIGSEEPSETWFTPAELFQPHYSHAIANLLVRIHSVCGTSPGSPSPEHRHPQRAQATDSHPLPAKRRRDLSVRKPRVVAKAHPKAAPTERARRLRVFEIGAGNGTNAVNMLDWVRKRSAGLYSDTELWSIEVSPLLAEKQKHALEGAGHGERLRSVVSDATNLSQDTLEQLAHQPDGCASVDMVVATEVLDNLPHDKVVWTGSTEPLQSAISAMAAVVARDHAPLLEQGPIAAAAAVALSLVREGAGVSPHRLPCFDPADIDALLGGWMAVNVAEHDDGGAVSMSEHLVSLRSDDTALSATIATVLAPAIVADAHRLSSFHGARSSPADAGDATGSALIKTLLGGMEAVRERLQGLLYSLEEREAPQGPWTARSALNGPDAGSQASGPARNAALRGAFPPFALPTKPTRHVVPPVLVPVPISTGDTDRPMGEAGTLPALDMGSALVRALRTPGGAASPAHVRAPDEPVLAVHVPSHCLRLFRHLHTVLPGHGLLFADFHALLGQNVGPTPVSGSSPQRSGTSSRQSGALGDLLVAARSSAANAAETARAWYSPNDPRAQCSSAGGSSVATRASVPAGHRLLAGGARDARCLEVDPTGGTVNPPVVQSKLQRNDGDRTGDEDGPDAPEAGWAVSWDHPSPLSPLPRGIADIFYATDFAALAAMWLAEAALCREVLAPGQALPRVAEVAWQPHLLDAAGVSDAGRTRSGFNPMLHDYANSSFLIAWPSPEDERR